MNKREKAIRELTRVIRRYYFEVINDNELKSRIDGTVYHWDSEQTKEFNFTLREATEKVIEPISKYFVERTSPYQWKIGEKLFHGYFPYKAGMGFLAAAFPEGFIRLMGDDMIPITDILSFAKKFFLSCSERKFYLDLLRKIEEGAKKN